MINTAQALWDKTLQPMLQKRGIDIRKYPPPDWTEHAFDKVRWARELGDLPHLSANENFLLFCIRHAHESKAQLYQDLLVRWKFKNKRDGFFVEFGATNGVDLSNTHSLEKQLGWRGILAEPARCWHDQLPQNRSCTIDKRCVWESSGQTLSFNEVESAELSTVGTLSNSDFHAVNREKGKVYDVQTISLNDLLAEHGAPSVMDFLSIDTEGSELLILKELDFSRFRFSIIAVEHNFTPLRVEIHSLLTAQGYARVFPELSKWDDWYFHESLLTQVT